MKSEDFVDDDRYLVDVHRIRTVEDIDWLFEHYSPDAKGRHRVTCDHCNAIARRAASATRQWFLRHDCLDLAGRPTLGRKQLPLVTESEAEAIEAQERANAVWEWAHRNPPELDVLDEDVLRRLWGGDLWEATARDIVKIAQLVHRHRSRVLDGVTTRRTLKVWEDSLQADVQARLERLELGLAENLRLSREIAARLRERWPDREGFDVLHAMPRSAEVIDIAVARRRLRPAA